MHSRIHQYGRALIFSLSATTGVGPDMLMTSSSTEAYFTVVIIIIGVLMSTFIVGSASNAMHAIDTEEVSYATPHVAA